MAIAFVAATDVSGTSTHTGAASPVACPAPAGRSVNDLLLCCIQDSGTAGSITTPSGWTLVEGPVISSTHTSWVYARYADTTSADDFSATITSPSQWLANQFAYSGCDTSGAILTTAIVSHANTFSGSAITVATTASVTTPAAPSCAIVGFFTEDSVGTSHLWSPTSTTPNIGTPVERFDVDEQTQKQEMCGDDAFGAAASTAYTMTVTLASAEVINSIALVLAPAGGTPTPGFFSSQGRPGPRLL